MPTIILLIGVALMPRAASADERATAKKSEPWRGLHLLQCKTDQDLANLAGQVPRLAALGLNVLILEIDYNFNFKSHRELRSGREPVTAEGAGKFAAVCRKHGVPLFLDACRFAENAWFIKQREPGHEQARPIEIAQAMFAEVTSASSS